MGTQERFSRRTFVAWVGGASAGFYLFRRIPGMSAPVALAQIPGGSLDPNSVPKFGTPMLIPPVMPKAATLKSAGRQAHRLLRDLDEADHGADPPGGL